MISTFNIERMIERYVNRDVSDEAQAELDALVEHIATLEQQVNMAKTDWTITADAYTDAIQQAERKGYELARRVVIEQWDAVLMSYDEAVKERDGGSAK